MTVCEFAEYSRSLSKRMGGTIMIPDITVSLNMKFVLMKRINL